MSFQEDIERGFEANKLLENAIYNEAISTVRNGIISKWQECPIRDREGAHELKLMLKCLDEIVGYVAQVATTGKLAQIQSEQEARMSKLKDFYPV